jgi:hypothetical protein
VEHVVEQKIEVAIVEQRVRLVGHGPDS